MTRPGRAAPDLCAIDGGYAHVPASMLASVWVALRDGRLSIADARTWCALLSVEAGLRASVQSGRRREATAAMIDQIARAYWADRPAAAHDRRVLRQRLTRLAAAGLAGDVSDLADTAGRQRWATVSCETTAAVESVLDGFRCPAGRTLRVPRRWLASFARQLTAGTFAAAVSVTFMCGWGRGASRGDVDRPAWSGRVSPAGAAKVLGLPARTLRAGVATLQRAGHIEPMADRAWAARRWGRRVRVCPGPAVTRPVDERVNGARRAAAGTSPGARRRAAPDQTQTRLRRNQIPRPTATPDAGAFGTGVCRQKGRKPNRKQAAGRNSTGNRSIRQRDAWQDVDLAAPTGVGRLYRRLVASGAIGKGPRDGVRFFAAAVRAREVSRRPVALLRWLVSHGRWEFITDGQDEQGHRDWKAWQRQCEDGPDSAWDESERTVRGHGGRVRSTGHRRNVTKPRRDGQQRVAETRDVHTKVPPPLPSEAIVRSAPADPELETSGENTVDQWPADVRVFVGQVAIGRARGWDLPSVRAKLARRDGWTTARVEAAEAEARERALLHDA